MYINDQAFLRRGKAPLEKTNKINKSSCLQYVITYTLSWSLKHYNLFTPQNKVTCSTSRKKLFPLKWKSFPNGQNIIYPIMTKFVTKWPTFKLEGQ